MSWVRNSKVLHLFSDGKIEEEEEISLKTHPRCRGITDKGLRSLAINIGANFKSIQNLDLDFRKYFFASKMNYSPLPC